MSEISVKLAKAEFSDVVDKAASGEFVTITRDGRPAAVVVSVEAAELARKAIAKDGKSLSAYLRTFPAGVDLDDEAFRRNAVPSRDSGL